jgi:hypothetical protein
VTGSELKMIKMSWLQAANIVEKIVTTGPFVEAFFSRCAARGASAKTAQFAMTKVAALSPVIKTEFYCHSGMPAVLAVAGPWLFAYVPEKYANWVGISHLSSKVS